MSSLKQLALVANGVRSFTLYMGKSSAGGVHRYKLHRIGHGATGIRSFRPYAGCVLLFRSRHFAEENRLQFAQDMKLMQRRPWSHNAMPPHQKVILPNLSPTMESGTIVSWEKEVGERINEGEVLAMIETDKATMEMETPDEGYLAKILIPAGTKDVAVKQVICIIVENEGDIDAFSNYTISQNEEDKVDAPSIETADKPVDKGQEESIDEKGGIVEQEKIKIQEVRKDGRAPASPLAKKLASEKGIDLMRVTGSGPNGRITVSDVENVVSASLAASTTGTDTFVSSPTETIPVERPHGQYTDLELSSMRKTIAKRLLEAKQSIPHYYLSVSVNMDNVLRTRQEFNADGKDKFKLSVNDFIIKAAALALKKVPECNSSWIGDFVRRYHNIDISVAVSTEGGLITPIVFDADKKGLLDINENVKELAEKARNKLLQPNEFVGGTFTISNLGMYGIQNFSAVINPPQSCILAVGSTERRLIVDDETENGFRPCNMMSVTLSCDHRVVDGAVGAEWLQHFKKYLEQPNTMLL